VAALGGTAGALLGVGLDRLFGGGTVLWAAAITFTAGAGLALSLPTTRRRRDPVRGRGREAVAGHPGETVPGPHRDPAPAPGSVTRPRPVPISGRRRGPLDRRAARLVRPPGRVRLARTANTCVRAVGGFTLFLLAFELRRQGVGTAGLGLLLAAVGVGGVVGAFLLPRAARLVREDGLLAGGLLLCGTTAWLLAGRVGVESAAAGGLAMGGGIAAARLGFESLVQREVPPPARGTAITRAETTFQLAWVAGAVLPVAFPLPTTPSLVAAAIVCLVAAITYTVGLLRLRRGRDRQSV
jgi:predicted MFS family arabinose efflux permease